MKCRWHIYPSSEELYKKAALGVARIANESANRGGVFRVVVCGGQTPKPLYRRLAAMDIEWHAWQVYFTDERCLPADHTERNSRLLHECLLDHVAIPRAQVHAIPAELGPEEGAAAYQRMLSDTNYFDLVVLGLGEDGHVASLFPGRDIRKDASATPVLAVYNSPKPPPERVTLSAERLSKSRNIMCLAIGASKRRALSDWITGYPLPVCSIHGMDGIDMFVDQDAWPV